MPSKIVIPADSDRESEPLTSHSAGSAPLDAFPIDCPLKQHPDFTVAADPEMEMLHSRFELIAQEQQRTPEALEVLSEIRQALESGRLRVAEPQDGNWMVHTWVKRALLLHSALGLAELQAAPFSGIELDTLRWRNGPVQGCRIPGGSLIREGAYLAPGVTCMPPAVIQVGAYVGEGSFIDSHGLIGLCAQVGRKVSVGCGSVIGGYLLPLESFPTIVEDHVILGGSCGVYEGICVGRGAVLIAGTTITPFHGVFDLRSGEWIQPDENNVLTVPPMSVVGMGSRVVEGTAGTVHLNIPVIVGTRPNEEDADFELAPGVNKIG